MAVKDKRFHVIGVYPAENQHRAEAGSDNLHRSLRDMAERNTNAEEGAHFYVLDTLTGKEYAPKRRGGLNGTEEAKERTFFFPDRKAALAFGRYLKGKGFKEGVRGLWTSHREKVTVKVEHLPSLHDKLDVSSEAMRLGANRISDLAWNGSSYSWQTTWKADGLEGINNPDYTHYVVVWKGEKRKGSNPVKGAKIESGWESNADAKERYVEIVDVESEGTGPFQDAQAAVVSKAIIKGSWKLDPKNDSDWFKHGEGLAESGLAPDEGEREDFDEFFNQYIGTALWSTNDESDDTGGEPLDANYDENDFEEESLKKLRDEAWEFFKTHQADFDKGWPKGVGAYSQAGHDFWLTRNRHGAGFWDGDWRKPYDDKLTEASHTYGEVDILVGDDGKLYV